MELKRNKELELQYKQIYNREVEINHGKELNEDGTIKRAIAEVISPKGKKYTLTEFLLNNATDFVLLDYGNKQQRYKSYLEAEVNMAHKIGSEEQK